MEKKYPINMPVTKFPMKANLANREPIWIDEWQEKKNL